MGKLADFLLSGASSLATGLINNALSQDNAREQREWQEQMWKKQNEYNDPSAMAARMRNAGLNPFTMTGAEPAGSAGTGASAQTIPINDPMTTLKTLAEYDNIVANTGKVETETTKVLKEVAQLEQLYRIGLITEKEKDLEFNKIKEAWKDRNPYSIELDNTEADTKAKEAQAKDSEASAGLKDAETALREAETAYQEAVTEYQNVLTSNADAESKARVQQMRASAQASLASAHEAMARAKLADIQGQVALDSEKRAQEIHVLKKQAEEYAVQLGATQAQIAELHRKLEERWDSDVPVWGHVLDIVHHNLNLGGSVGKSFK